MRGGTDNRVMAQSSSRIRSCCGIVAVPIILLAIGGGGAEGQGRAVDGIEHSETVFPAQSAYRPQREIGGDSGEIGFVLGNIEYLLVHEIAHLLIGEKNIPIIGPVENAADYIATLALIREEPLDPAQRDRAERFLLASAGAFAASWQAGRALDADVPYWGTHALSIQRYYQIVCLLYGSDPAAFADVLQSAGVPEAKAQSCIAEYARANEAAEWLLRNYGRRPGDIAGTATEIVYGRPPTVVSTGVVRELRSIELLERVMGRLHERFTIERPFTLVMRSCGQPEAAWMPDVRELVICYELIDTLYVLGMRANAMEHQRPKARARFRR
jgi:hypothetical protein